MTPGLMTVVLALGAGSLALWIDARFPKLEPHGLEPRLLGYLVGVPVALVLVAPAGLHLLTNADTLALKLVGLIGVAFPCLVYAFLVAVWILKIVQRASMHGLR